MRHKLLAALLSACALMARPAAAQTFTVTFKGAVSSFSGGVSPFDSTVAVGTPYTLTFTWDRSIPASPLSAYETRWTTTAPAFAAVLSVGDAKVAPPPKPDSQFQTYIDAGNAHGVRSGGILDETNGEAVTGAVYPTSAVTLIAERYNASGAVPITVNLSDPGADWLDPFALADVDLLYNANSQTGAMTMRVDSVTGTGLTPAPEPSQTASLGLGALGLAVLMIRGRRWV